MASSCQHTHTQTTERQTGRQAGARTHTHTHQHAPPPAQRVCCQGLWAIWHPDKQRFFCSGLTRGGFGSRMVGFWLCTSLALHLQKLRTSGTKGFVCCAWLLVSYGSQPVALYLLPRALLSLNAMSIFWLLLLSRVATDSGAAALRGSTGAGLQALGFRCVTTGD